MSTNVTVNGIPLEEHLSEQAGREIAKVRSADERPVPIRNHTLSKRMRNHNRNYTKAPQWARSEVKETSWTAYL